MIEDILSFAREKGLAVCGLDYSPIKGPEGNIEYLVCLADSGEDVSVSAKEVADAAHNNSF